MNSSNVCLVSVNTFEIGPIIVINNNYWTDLVSLTSQTLKLLMAKKPHFQGESSKCFICQDCETGYQM